MPAWINQPSLAVSNDFSELSFLKGEITIVDASQTETSAFAILNVAPVANCPLRDVEIWLDLAKATTGFAAIETSITIQLALGRKVDATNWRREAYAEAALSGTNAANRMARLVAGGVSAEAGLRVYAVFSADITNNIVIPYTVAYRGRAVPVLS